MKLNEAFAAASQHHAGALKKGTSFPFLYHPLAVAALVLKHGGSEAQVQAALLHDTIGDGQVTQAELAKRFGDEVAHLVFTFADPEVSPAVAADWHQLRGAYLDKLREQKPEALLIVACEELHELGELLTDLQRQGAEVWTRYPVPANVVFWYFRELLVIFNKRLSAERYRNLVTEFASLIRKFQATLFDGAKV